MPEAVTLDTKVDIFDLARREIPSVNLPEDAEKFDSRGDHIEGYWIETKGRGEGKEKTYSVTVIDSTDPRRVVASREYSDKRIAFIEHLRVKIYLERGQHGHSG